MSNPTDTFKVYLVTLDTPNGEAELEVPTHLGPEAAGRRATMVALKMGWGDLDEIEVVSVGDAENQA